MSIWPLRAAEIVSCDGFRLYADQPRTLPELLERSVMGHHSAPAAHDVAGRGLTFEELWTETERVAGDMQRRHGIEPGDQVAFVAANSLESARRRHRHVARGWGRGDDLREVHEGQIEQRLALCTPRLSLRSRRREATSRATSFCSEASTARVRAARAGAADPALLMFTSGTTGASKAVIQLHMNLVSAAETWVRRLDLRPSDTTVVAAPMYHVTGLNGQALPVLAAGGSVAIMPRFGAAALVDQLEAGAATFFHASPTIYTLTMRAAQDRRARRLRSCVSGGAFVGRGLIHDAQTFAPGCDFRISYGMTETSSPAVLTPPGWIDERPGDAVGVAVPVDDVAVDDVGEILFRGATVISGGDWLHSGDIGAIDEQGFVTIVDRIKDIINRGGEKIGVDRGRGHARLAPRRARGRGRSDARWHLRRGADRVRRRRRRC